MSERQKYQCTVGYLYGDKLIKHELYHMHSVNFYANNQHQKISITEFVEENYPVRTVNDIFGDDGIFKIHPRKEIAFLEFIKHN